MSMPASKEREAILRIVERRAELDKRFSNIRRLGPSGGHGHFSVLFRAYDRITNKDVALKFYDPLRTFASDAAYRIGSFQREAKILEELSGEPDIIGWVAPINQFTEQFDAGGISLDLPFTYFALELAETDLGSVINSRVLPAESVLQWFHQMCTSVRRLHHRGYAHRDLKPTNFLIMPDGSVRLSDFGTAKKLTDSSPALSASYIYPPGDLAYAAPEILAALLDDDPKLAFKADKFALGAVLFEMVTGVVLGFQLFNARYRDDLTQMMAEIKKGKRKEMFDRLIPSIADGHPLPNLFTFAPAMSLSILPLLDRLYKEMAHLDYRKRLDDFDRVWLRIESCLKIVNNEEGYRKLRERRMRAKAAREAKYARCGARAEVEKKELS
jgi:serine/threonine protein kinase